MRHLKFQVRAQHIGLIGAPWRPGRDHHAAHEHPEVELALSLNHTELLAERLDLLLGQYRLEDLPYFVTGHGFSPHAVPSHVCCFQDASGGRVEDAGTPESSRTGVRFLKFQHNGQPRAVSPYLARMSWRVPTPGGTSLSLAPNSSEYSAI